MPHPTDEAQHRLAVASEKTASELALRRLQSDRRINERKNRSILELNALTENLREARKDLDLSVKRAEHNLWSTKVKKARNALFAVTFLSGLVAWATGSTSFWFSSALMFIALAISQFLLIAFPEPSESVSLPVASDVASDEQLWLAEERVRIDAEIERHQHVVNAREVS